MALYKIAYNCFTVEPKIGGYGLTILDDKNKKIASESGGENKSGTENRLCLYAVLVGLRMLPDKSDVFLISNNEYSIKTSLNLYKRNANIDILEAIDNEKRRMKSINYVSLKDIEKKEKEYLSYCESLAKECVSRKQFSNPIDYYPNKCASPDEDAKVKEELERKLEINKHLDILQDAINQLQNEINELRKMN